MIVNLMILLLLVFSAASGFFALAGYTMGVYRRPHMERPPRGEDKLRRLHRIETFIGDLRLTAWFCWSASNLALVITSLRLFGTSDWGAGGTILAAGVAAMIIAIVGLAVPYSWALHRGERIIFHVGPVLMIFRYVLYPIVKAMSTVQVPVRRMLGVDDQGENGRSAKQEILHAASEGRAEGAVDAEEVRMIKSVIEFGETRAGEIMTPRTDVFALPAEMSWEDACGRIIQAGHTRVPVYQGDLDNVVGVLYAKDMLRYYRQHDQPIVRQIMRKCYFVPETKPLDDLLREFKARKVHIAVVLDEYGGTAGVVTIEDVLEEIVGEITDEYDRAEPVLMNRIDARTAEVDGRMYIDDLNEAMELRIPEDEHYDTVAGFVFSELGYVPKPQEVLETHGARFTILDADERKIKNIRVRRIKDYHEEGKS